MMRGMVLDGLGLTLLLWPPRSSTAFGRAASLGRVRQIRRQRPLVRTLLDRPGRLRDGDHRTRRRRATMSSGRRRGGAQPDLDLCSTLGRAPDREGSPERVDAVNQAAESGAGPHDRPSDPVVLHGRSEVRAGALDLDPDHRRA